MSQQSKFSWKYKDGTTGVKPANLPGAAYGASLGGLSYYAAKGYEVEYCKKCITAKVGGKVLAYSTKKYGEARCWNCQQKENK